MQTGLLLNTQWDAFYTVRDNLVPQWGVPGACQPDLGVLCWGTGIKKNLSQLTVTETGWRIERNYHHAHKHKHTHILINTILQRQKRIYACIYT